MKVFLKLFLLITLIFIKAPIVIAEEKISYLNLDKVLSGTNSGKIILKDLDELKKKNADDFKKKRNEIRTQEENLLKQKNILSKEEFEKKIIDLKNEVNKFNIERNKTIDEFNKIKKKRIG